MPQCSVECPSSHFKWISIRRFLYLAFAFSSTTRTFDVFQRLANDEDTIYSFICLEVAVGMPYMCMDFFIKQYTRKLDFNSTLNPMLKGITVGIMLQSLIWMFIHASFLGDTARYLFSCFNDDPIWSTCRSDETCVPARDVIMICHQLKNKTPIVSTSSHINYLKFISSDDQVDFTTHFFIIAIVWIITFLFTISSETTILKFYKMAFMWRCISTTVTLIILMIFKTPNVGLILSRMLKLKRTKIKTDRVLYAFGIGVIGIHDFGMMSPYTMVDNCVVLYTVVFTTLSFATSFIMSILCASIHDCVEISRQITSNYLLFVVLPLGTEFFNTQKIYMLYVYMNLVFAMHAYLAFVTLTIAKLLHSEFRTVKSVYFIGFTCVMGFIFSMPVTWIFSTEAVKSGLIYGLNVNVLYLGSMKSLIVMWVYGVKRFSTDIHFWLGFKPTRFWTLCWAFLPFSLSVLVVSMTIDLLAMLNVDRMKALVAIAWILLTMLIVFIIFLKTVMKYLVHNNLVAVFRSSPKYGPPDHDDRKRRRNYNEAEHHRICTHGCVIIDNKIDCNHLPLMNPTLHGSLNEDESIRSLYEGTETTRDSSLDDLNPMLFDLDSHNKRE